MSDPLQGLPLPEKTPDAAFIPANFSMGRHTIEHINSITGIADRLLGVAPTKREKSYGRPHPTGKHFFTKDPHDTILFAKSHPQAGEPRYHWVDWNLGIELGYLMEDARA